MRLEISSLKLLQRVSKKLIMQQTEFQKAEFHVFYINHIKWNILKLFFFEYLKLLDYLSLCSGPAKISYISWCHSV